MFEDLKEKASEFMKDGNVKEVVEKVQEFAASEKGKEVIDTVKEKVTEFMSHKK